jgi:CitMHS family citrate-Mg2+:H+ or citrate-Ca2+:H+ symporter
VPVLLAQTLFRILTPLSALIAVPLVAALAGGFGVSTGSFIVHGIRGVASMIIFALSTFRIVMGQRCLRCGCVSMARAQ